MSIKDSMTSTSFTLSQDLFDRIRAEQERVGSRTASPVICALVEDGLGLRQGFAEKNGAVGAIAAVDKHLVIMLDWLNRAIREEGNKEPREELRKVRTEIEDVSFAVGESLRVLRDAEGGGATR